MRDMTDARTTDTLLPSVLALCLSALSIAPALGQAREATVAVRDRAELVRAVANATPGTRIEMAPGTYAGGLHFSGVKGKPGSPIVIAAADRAGRPIIDGGNTGMHLSGVEHLELHDLVLQNARGNGLNIDDAGTFVRPAHHVVLRRLHVRDVGPKGNRDGIKLSGLDDFRVERCVVERWGDRGQGIDMVGCHRGVIDGCTLRHGDDRGAGVQTKGGSRDVRIVRCRFEHAGSRAVNVGGSTGLKYFRPPLESGLAHAEARDIVVEGCTFIGSAAPVAFVGVDGAVVRLNTIYRPKRWVLRILQETRGPGFVPCRGGVFSANIIAFRSDEVRATVNIGPATSPETFSFSRNWWYCIDRPARSKPQLPRPGSEGTVGKAPQFVSPEAGDLRLRPDSLARGVGATALVEE